MSNELKTLVAAMEAAKAEREEAGIRDAAIKKMRKAISFRTDDLYHWSLDELVKDYGGTKSSLAQSLFEAALLDFFKEIGVEFEELQAKYFEAKKRERKKNVPSSR